MFVYLNYSVIFILKTAILTPIFMYLIILTFLLVFNSMCLIMFFNYLLL